MYELITRSLEFTGMPISSPLFDFNSFTSCPSRIRNNNHFDLAHLQHASRLSRIIFCATGYALSGSVQWLCTHRGNSTIPMDHLTAIRESQLILVVIPVNPPAMFRLRTRLTRVHIPASYHSFAIHSPTLANATDIRSGQVSYASRSN